MPGIVRAAIYCRISQDRLDKSTGVKKAEGVQRQEASCREKAQDLGWDVADVYVDNDVSATSGRVRPEFRRMTADIKAGRIDAVIAYHVDRLIRRPVELEAFIDLVEDHKIALSTVSAGDYDLSTSSGKMVARMLGAAARHEVDRMSDRLQAVKIAKAQAGLWKGGSRPFGHRSVPGPNGEAGYLEIVPLEAEVLRQTVDAFLAGATLHSIARELQQRGVLRTKGDTNWSPSDVSRMISRPVAAGIVTYRGEVLGKGVWPAIIPEDKWLAVRHVLAQPSRKTNPGRRQVHLLSGIARCGGPLSEGDVCGATLMANAGDFYRCSSGRNGTVRREGHHVYRKRSDLDAYVRELVLARLSLPDAVDLVVPSQTSPEDTVALAREADDLRKRQADLALMYADGSITRSQMATSSARIKASLEGVEGRLAAAVYTSPQPVVPELGDGDGTDVPSVHALRVWEGLTDERRREVVKALMAITVKPSDRRGRNPFKTSDVEVTWAT